MSAATRTGQVAPAAASADPLQPPTRLFRDLRTSPAGLSAREAARRLEVYGPNELSRRGGRRWPGELARQFTHSGGLLARSWGFLGLISASLVMAGFFLTPGTPAGIPGRRPAPAAR